MKIEVTKTCAMYARSPRSGPNSVEHQLTACRLEAEARGWSINADSVSTDEGKVANLAMIKRPGLQRLLTMVQQENRGFDCLLIESPIRLSRIVTEFLSVYSLLSRHGIAVHAVNTQPRN